MSERKPTNSPETKADVLARLLTRGGYLLIAGGEMSNLPDKVRSHPQIIIWDDNDQDWQHKTVPSNVRGIIFNSWISHPKVAILRRAAASLNVPIFPFLKTREIKELVSETLQLQEPVPTVPEAPIELPPPQPEEATPDAPAFLTPEDTMRKPTRGTLLRFVQDNFHQPDNLKKGWIADEGRRLFVLAKKAGIKTTEGSVIQVVSKLSRDSKTSTRRTTTTTAPPVRTDDFAEAEKMLRDAKAAIELLIDFIPKLRKEVAEHRKRQEKLRELLG